MQVYVLWRYVHDFSEEPKREIAGIFLTYNEALIYNTSGIFEIQEVTTGKFIKD